jgi:hypothetical protein
MKTYFAAALLAAVTLVVATNSNDAHAGVQVKVENKCGSSAPYVLKKKGSSLNTSLSSRSSTTHALDVGDQIMVGKQVLHTVSSGSGKQPVIVCQK